MADPVTLAMVGAAAGAALKPKNPLQGAMLGAATGFTGGAALGATPAVAAGATGLGAGGAALPGVMGAAPAILPASTSGFALNSALPSMIPNIASPALNAAAMATPFNIASTAPTFTQQLGGAGSYLANNPMQTLQTANSVQGLLTPEQAPQAQPGQVQRGQPLPPVDFAALLNPQQYKPQPISLLG